MTASHAGARARTQRATPYGGVLRTLFSVVVALPGSDSPLSYGTEVSQT